MSKLTDLFYKNAELRPAKPAIWCDGKSVTYGEFAVMVSKISNLLLKHGFQQGDNIGVPMTNSIEAVALFFAAAEIGVALAPINPTLPIESISLAFESVGTKGVIARKSFYSQYKKTNEICFCFDAEKEGTIPFESYQNCSAERPDINVDEETALILTMTSGSTGEPKPIELSQKNKIDRAFAHIRMYSITDADRILAATPLYHSLAERLVIMPLLIGATSILLPRFTPNLWLNCISQQKVTFTIAVSAQLGQVAQLLSSPFLPQIDSLRCLVSSSSLLEAHVRKELITKLKCDFHEMYGTSEVSTVTDINFNEAKHKIYSVGKCIDCASIKIVGNNGEELPVEEVGEIICKSSLAFKGYYKLPEKTKASYLGEYFMTGDLGKVDSDGFLYFCGRKKELIITGGINVYPVDVECALAGLNGVSECAAFSYPDERLGEVVAVAIVREGESLTRKNVQAYCARSLADFQQPHHIFFLKSLPKNAMGKLMRRKLYETVKTQGELE